MTAQEFVMELVQQSSVPVETEVCQLDAISVPRKTTELEKLGKLTKMLELSM